MWSGVPQDGSEHDSQCEKADRNVAEHGITYEVAGRIARDKDTGEGGREGAGSLLEGGVYCHETTTIT
jgi:hypothetical protein